MSIYESGLYNVIDYILAKKNCLIEDAHAHEMLKEILKNNIQQFAVQTADTANLAGRRISGFFDLEHTFNFMNIRVQDLVDIWTKDKSRVHPIIGIKSAEIPDNDYHKESPMLMSIPSERETGHSVHLHEHLPEFPGVHTYQKTWLALKLDQNYIDIRNSSATNQMNIQKALNSYYLRSRTSYSLFLTPKSTNCYDVLAVEPSDLRKPAFLSALLSPRELCNQHPIEEDDEKAVVNSPFMAPPLKKSKFPRKPIPDEDLKNTSAPPMTTGSRWHNRSKRYESSEDDDGTSDEDEKKKEEEEYSSQSE